MFLQNAGSTPPLPWSPEGDERLVGVRAVPLGERAGDEDRLGGGVGIDRWTPLLPPSALDCVPVIFGIPGGQDAVGCLELGAEVGEGGGGVGAVAVVSGDHGVADQADGLNVADRGCLPVGGAGCGIYDPSLVGRQVRRGVTADADDQRGGGDTQCCRVTASPSYAP